MVVKRTTTANILVLVTRVGAGGFFGAAGVGATLVGTVEPVVFARTVLATVHFTIVLMDTVVEVLVQMNNIIIVVVVLIAVVLAHVPAIRRRTVRAGQVEIHRTLTVPKAVRKVQSIRVALIKRVEVCETE